MALGSFPNPFPYPFPQPINLSPGIGGVSYAPLSLPPVPKVPSEDIIEGPPGTITVLSIKSQQSVAVSKS